MAKKLLHTMTYSLWCVAGMVMPFVSCPSPLYATASFQLLSSPFSDCQACGTSDSPNCTPDECRDWWASVDFIVDGIKMKHGREELGANGFTVEDVPEGAAISLGFVGTYKNYTLNERVHSGENIFKCSGAFWKNCSKDKDTGKDFTCKCWRVK